MNFPLRALSAQTRALYSAHLGHSARPSPPSTAVLVSQALTKMPFASDIVVTTPEKIDFALRNDPSLLDDVGLLVFDEGHMIGLGERESPIRSSRSSASCVALTLINVV